MDKNRFYVGLVLLLTIGFLATACTAITTTTKPVVVIESPPSNSEFHGDETVTVQSTSTDSSGITRVELLVDGNIVRTDTTPSPQQSFIVVQTWKATPGSHLITVRAYNTAGAVSDPAVIQVAVQPSGPAAAPTSPPTTSPPPPTAGPAATNTPVPAPTAAPAACTDNATFVADVTVPDGTVLAPGQAFNKIWRMRNTGTCTWGSGYEFAFISGALMGATRSIGVPATAPNATADFLVRMVAPTTPGTHTGNWRLRRTGGSFFGGSVFVTIRVPSPAPAPTAVPPTPAPVTCSGTPILNGFSTSAGTISAGQSATLSWGAVLNAERAEIDNGIGGVPAPGSVTVSPTTTTTYTLTGHCGANTTSAQVTITVSSAPAVCSGTPVLNGFSVSPATITSGNSATLSWGLVLNADRAEIDHSIGGVGTPGNVTVSPTTTTTYTLTGRCGANTTSAQVTVTVNQP